ncbi:MAG TPA: 3-phosphoshikimate 1-carboxyvinyltransferase [Terriglobales bacterium]|nr:3-phosphoshikimate 1-carboxyvinyltransferase [Terriglobales bacterium]
MPAVPTAMPFLPESQVVYPATTVSGMLRMPGDKSISHRYAMLAAIAEGASRLHNYSTGQDCASTLSCLRELGCDWKKDSAADNTIIIEGHGPMLDKPKQALNCGNSGSTMRMLSGILAGQDFACELIGDESLSRRPMARIMAPLRQMGAEISAAEGQRPPLLIHGAKLKAIEYTTPVASAQVKSCVLFAGLLADGVTQVSEPVRTRDHGELALRAFGAEVHKDGNRACIRGGQQLHGIEATIPGDISSAAFFLCAAALFPESELTISGLLMNPTRARLLDFLIQLGVKVAVVQIEQHHGELVGTVEVKGGALGGITISGADSAALIDELPVLAAIAPYTRAGVEIRDASELRVKESDRIAVVAQSLRAMGARVEERADGLAVPGDQSLHGAEIDSRGDHRIAMAFAVAALRAQGATRILNADAADVSYPGFFRDLATVAQR